MGKSEWLLWAELRRSQIGFVVRRQFAVGPYVLDFFVYEAKLCIEVDGEHHALRVDRDLNRDTYLAELGISTMRIESLELFTNLSGVVERIYAECVRRTGRDPLAS